MNFRGTIWTVCVLVFDAVIDVTANTFDVIGSLACMAAGTGFAASFAIDETIRATYYGFANTTGSQSLDFLIPAFGYTINKKMPIVHVEQVDGEFTYQVTDLVSPTTVRVVSAALVASGLFLRLLSANMKQWRQGREDQNYYKSHHGIHIKSPPLKEYYFVSAESVFGSISYALVSTAVVGTIINSSGLLGSNQSLTYPSNANDQANGTYYKGPVNTILIPFDYTLNENNSLDSTVTDIKVGVEEHIEAHVRINGQYGGGLFFQSNNHAQFPVAIPSTIAGGTYGANRFFAKKATQHREERIYQSQQPEGLPL